MPACQAVVSGGYLRDMLHGIAPKDMDVFIQSDTNGSPSAEMLKVIECIVGPVSWLHANGEYWGSAEVVRVGEAAYKPLTDDTVFSVKHPVPINVIVLDKGIIPEDDARLNDFGMCQIWYDGHGLGYSKAFLLDSMWKNFTLKVCENYEQFERSMRRWLRLREKYPNHRLVIPDQYKEFERCSSVLAEAREHGSPDLLLPLQS